MAHWRLLCFCVLFVFHIFPVSVLAKDKPQRMQTNRDIRVEAGEQTGDVTCINCSIYVRGKVDGDATAIHGSILVEPGASVTGDTTTILGDVRAENGSSLAGDVTSVGGHVRRQAQATVGGDVTSMGGLGWTLLLLLPPLVILGLIVALILWLVQRSQRQAPAAA